MFDPKENFCPLRASAGLGGESPPQQMNGQHPDGPGRGAPSDPPAVPHGPLPLPLQLPHERLRGGGRAGGLVLWEQRLPGQRGERRAEETNLPQKTVSGFLEKSK